ncbi:MAG: ROK family protein [Planctomycetota bacterium]
MVTSDHEAQILSLLQQLGPLSRQQLHERTGLRPNTVGDVASQLLERGLLVEGEPQAVGPGRPRVPLQIDESQCWVVGLALKPGSVKGCRVNLQGRRIGRALSQPLREGEAVTDAAATMLKRLLAPEAVAVGVTTTGLLDAESRRILFSTAVPDHRPTSAQPIYDAAGDLPLRFDNDMRAWATRWQLTHPATPREDLLLVHVRDGAIGSALMVDGKPNRGCVVGGNELGYTRLPIDGEAMKLEDIFSSAFLQRIAPNTAGGLDERVADYAPDDTALIRATELLALGLANTCNFVRPHRLVLASDLTRHARFYHALLDAMKRTMLTPVAERMRIDTWEDSLPQGAEAAGWLVLDLIYRSPETSGTV